MKPITDIISIALIGGGALGFALVSKPLLASREADVPLNVLGINHSPYGEVFAMAMQGPIDSYFHATTAQGHECAGSGKCGHGAHSDAPAETVSGGTNDRMRHFIEGMGEGLVERTNSRDASQAQRFYLRRQIEDKLRFAYNLDPGHYGNYNAYHFFLTQPQLGTRPELTPHAAKLADDTIKYCFARHNDPRQALTAAAAAGNVIELMLNDRQIHSENPRYTTAQMREVLAVMDRSFGLYSRLSDEWSGNGTWKNLSALRLQEVEERLRFTLKIRDSHEQSIRRLEGRADNGDTVSNTAGPRNQNIR